MNENGNITKYKIFQSNGLLWQSAAIAALKAATVIKNEDVNTPRHTERLQWAWTIMANPDAWVQANKWNIIQSAPIISGGDAATDNNIESAVNALMPDTN